MITDNLANYIKKSEKGKNNGVCELDGNGLVPLTRLNPNVLEFKGDWDALINSPLLTNGVGSIYTGNLYIVSVAGTQWGIEFEIGDFVVYDGSIWKKIPASTGNTYLKKANNLSDLANVATARTNLSVYSKAEINTMENIDAIRFQTSFYGSQSYPTFNLWTNQPTNNIMGIATRYVWSADAIDITPLNSNKYFNIEQQLSALTSAIVYVYKYDNTGGFGNTVWCNTYIITSILNAPDGNGYMEWNVTPVSTSHTFIAGEKLLVSIIPQKPDQTLTSGNNFLAISGTGASKILTVRSNAYLSGAVTITAGGLLELGGVSQTGHPYVTSGSTMTVNDDLIISGSLTMASNSNLVVEGNLIVLGLVSLASSTTITATGIIQFRGLTGTDTFTCNGCVINSYDEFSVRNYTSTAYMFFTGTNSIKARTIVFEGNTTSCYFNGTASTHTLEADDIVFRGNSNKLSGTGANGTVTMYNMTINANSLRFLNNTSTIFTADLRTNVAITVNTFEFISNTSTGALGGYTLYAPGLNITCENIRFKDNSHTTDSALYFTATTVINTRNISFLNNIGGGSTGVIADSGAKIYADLINIVVSGATQSISWGGNIYGLFPATTRVPRYIINNSGATITGFNKDSFLGLIPMAWKTFNNFASQYSTPVGTTSGAVKINPGFTVGEQTNTVSDQFENTGSSLITYVGLDSAVVQITATLTFKTASTVNQDYGFEVYKNGSTKLSNSTQFVTHINTRGYINISLECNDSVNPNDYYQLSCYIQTVNGGSNPVNLSFPSINWSVNKLNIM